MRKLSLSHQEVNITPLTISVNLWGWISDWLNKVCRVDNFGSMVCLIKNYKLDFYVDRKKFLSAHNEVCSKIQRNTLSVDFAIKKSEELGDKIKNAVLEYYSVIDKLNEKKVIKTFSDIFDWSRKLCSFGYIAPLSDWPEEFISKRTEEILKGKVNEKDFVQIKVLLSQSNKKYPKDIAKEELLKLIIANKKIDEWISKWFWLDFGHIGKKITEKKIKSDYQEFFKNPDKAVLELKHVSDEYSNLRKRQEKLFKDLQFSTKEKNIFYYAQKLSFLKGYRMDILSCANTFFDYLFNNYSKKLGIDKEIFRFSTKDEIINYIQGVKPGPAIILRKRESLWILESEEEGIKILIEKEAGDFKGKYLVREEKIQGSDVVEGRSAFSGIVKGRVKIVNSYKDMRKINNGDILVSIQTTPELLPAMKRAAAFVTDIGGITSHAAIVSRELKKPCIVGTKYATKVLKDGDLVEVDANKGIIRKLK